MKTALAMMLFAIVIDTTRLADGGRDAWLEGNRRVTAEKIGEETHIRVQEDRRVDTLVVTRENGELKVTHSDNGVPRAFNLNKRAPVIVDGMDMEPFLTGHQSQPQPRKSIEKKVAARYYICPVDESMLRVKVPNPAATYKCPVDGATMRAGLGPNQQYWLLE